MEGKYDKYRDKFAAHKDEELLVIATDNNEDYEDEAILAARYELEKRGIDYRNVNPNLLSDEEGDSPVYIREASEYTRAYRLINQIDFDSVESILANEFEMDDEFMDGFREHFDMMKNGDWEAEESEKGIALIASLANMQENQTDFDTYLIGLDWNSNNKIYLEGLNSEYWPYLLVYKRDVKSQGADRMVATLLWQYNFVLQAESFEFDDSADGMIYHDHDWNLE